MSSRRWSAIQSIALVAAVALVSPSCHVADVMAPTGASSLRLAFAGDSALVAGTRSLADVSVSGGPAPAVLPRLRFASSDTNVVAISPVGDSLVARALGTATVTAWVESSLLPETPPTARRVFVVVPKSFTIPPGQFTLAAIGDTMSLVAEGRDARDSTLDVSAAQWRLARLADSTIVRLSGTRVTATGPGTATVLATIAGDTASASILVAQRLARFAFAGAGVTLDAIGADTTLVVTALDATGHLIASAPAPIWESADTTTATVDGTGRVRAVRNGTTYIRARRPAPDGGADSTVLVVDQRAVRLTILPPRRDTIGTRDTLTLDAVSEDRLGHSVTDGVPRWSSSATNVIDFGSGAAGNRVVLNSYGPGNASITAVLDGQRDSVRMTVVNQPALVRVTPDSALILSARDSTQMRATVYNASGDSIPGASVTWATPDTLVARVGAPGGWFVAVDSGRARVIARTLAANGILLADTSVVVVTNAPRVVDLTLAVDTLTVLGAQQLLPVRILNAINDTLPRTRVHWETRDAGVATVTSVGQITATGPGATWVVAWADSARDSTRVVVYNVAASVSIDGVATGVPDTIPSPGSSITYTATVRNATGGVLGAYPVTWSSTIPAVATVNAGVVTATGFGTTNIIVRASGVADTVVIVVRHPTHWHVDAARAGSGALGTFARPFATIGAAVDRTSAGDTVIIASGSTYRETVSVAKTLTIVGDSTDFIANGHDPNRLPAIVNATGTGAILISGGAIDLRHLVIRHTADGPAIAAADADVNLTMVLVNPGSADSPRGSGILIERAPQTARLDSVVVEGVVGYGVRIRNSAGVRVLRARVHGVRLAGGATSEDGAGISVSGGRGAMIGSATVRTADGPAVLLSGTADATVDRGNFAGQRQLVLVEGASGLTTVSDNVFDLARPADESYTGSSVTDGRAGLTIRGGSTGVQSLRSQFRDAGGTSSLMDAIRLEDARAAVLSSTHVTGGRRAVVSTRSSWTMSASRADNVALGVETLGSDTLTLTDDTLSSAGVGCGSFRAGEATLTRVVATQCGVGDAPAFAIVGGGTTFTGLTISGSNPRAIAADSARRVLVRGSTVNGPGAATLGVAGNGGVQLAGDSVSLVNSFLSGFPDRAAAWLGGGYVRVDSTSIYRSRIALQIAGAPTALTIRDDDLWDADSAALILASGSAPNVWWGDGRGPRGTAANTLGDTIVGTVATAPLRTVPMRPGVTATRMVMLRGDGQSVASGSSLLPLPYMLSVRVTDANGLPVRNVAVKFVVTSNPSTLRADLGTSGVKTLNVITNDSGIAEATMRIRDRGVYTVTVTAPGVSDTIIFTETGT